jgi:HAMP domain-containing protein
MVATYLVALFAMAFAACVAITWIYAVRHVDPREDAANPSETVKKIAA